MSLDINRVLAWAERLKQLPWKTGIYPAEMAIFLGLCEQEGVKTIIESGRGPDAYSTQAIGMYTEQHPNVRAHSVDVFHPRRFHYRPLLKKYSRLRCWTGNAFRWVPLITMFTRKPIALLVDGPKAHAAVKLSASVRQRIRVVAHHNTPPDAPWLSDFRAIFPDAHHYEDLPLNSDPRWLAFREWEKRATGGYETDDTTHGITGRSLQQSSLIFAVRK